MTDTFESALDYARRLGAEHGESAASWVDLDETSAARIARGIADGDPEILDSLPCADLSGQWADTLTGPQLVLEALEHAESGVIDVDDPRLADWFTDICDAYESAFGDAVVASLETRCAYYLSDEDGSASVTLLAALLPMLFFVILVAPFVTMLTTLSAH